MIALVAAVVLGAGGPTPAPSGAPWTARDRAALTARLDAALAGPAVRSAHAGLLAVAASDGAVLYARNADAAFQPASTLKLLVGSVALERLGADARFHTDAVAGGPLTDGVLDGPLVVRAGGDPFLGTKDLADLARTLAARGTHAIRGGVAFELGRYEPPGYPPGWTVDDLPSEYAPVIGALAFEGNVARFAVAPGPAPGAAAVVSPLSPFALVATCAPGAVVAAVTTVPAEATAATDVERTRTGCTRITGSVAAGAAPERLGAAVPFPALYAGRALRAALGAAGIVVGPQPAGDVPDAYLAAAPPRAPILWRHDSEPLADVLADLWLPSDNLIAEVLLDEVGVAARGTPGTRAAGIAAELAWLAALGVDTSPVALADGSGVSAYDRLSPRALVAVLRRDWDGPHRGLVLDALPLAGRRGTLASAMRGTPAEGRIFAKTGSLSRARALAGYAANVRHGAVVFAFVVDEWTGDDPSALDAVRDRVAVALAED